MSGQIAIFETAGPHVHLEYIIACSPIFLHSSSNKLQMKLLVWGKCHHQMGGHPMGFAGFEYGFLIGYEASLSRFRVQRQLLITLLTLFIHKFCLLKSCWSDAVGPQQLCRCAKPSGSRPQKVELRERQLHNLRPRVCIHLQHALTSINV